MVAVECPGTEFHDAGLLVEREVRDVDGAGTLVDRRWDPEDVAVRIDEHVALVSHLVVAVRAGKFFFFQKRKNEKMGKSVRKL